MFCKKCGRSVADSSTFCPYCGADLRAVPKPEAPKAPAPDQRQQAPAAAQQAPNPGQQTPNYNQAPAPAPVPANYNQPNQQQGPVSDKDWTTTLLLCIFLGGIGIHRFYVGKTGTGIIMLLMVLLCGSSFIWAFIDLIMIITGDFKDANGLPLKR